MEKVLLSEINPYNETDCACNGGYYSCPNCGECLYVSQADNGDHSQCDKCLNQHEFIEK
jgi:hypothetical protein